MRIIQNNKYSLFWSENLFKIFVFICFPVVPNMTSTKFTCFIEIKNTLQQTKKYRFFNKSSLKVFLCSGIFLMEFTVKAFQMGERYFLLIEDECTKKKVVFFHLLPSFYSPGWKNFSLVYEEICLLVNSLNFPLNRDFSHKIKHYSPKIL